MIVKVATKIRNRTYLIGTEPIHAAVVDVGAQFHCVVLGMRGTPSGTST